MRNQYYKRGDLVVYLVIAIVLLFLSGCAKGNSAPDLPVKLNTAMQLIQDDYDISGLVFKMVPDDQYCMTVQPATGLVSVRNYCVETSSVTQLGCTIVCELAHVNGAKTEKGCIDAQNECLNKYS